MWNDLLYEIVKNVLIPELAAYIRKRYEETGTWPSREEMENKAIRLAGDIKTAGHEFLKRLESDVNTEDNRK